MTVAQMERAANSNPRASAEGSTSVVGWKEAIAGCLRRFFVCGEGAATLDRQSSLEGGFRGS